MPIVITAFTEDHVPAVKAFNGRLSRGEGYAEFQFPEAPAPTGDGHRRAEEYFLALGEGSVRGAYILNRQAFSVRGAMRSVAHYRLPVSEGALDRAYAGVGVQMLRTALKYEPLLFALGMGGESRELPRMLRAMGWQLHPVPFYFHVLRPAQCLRELRMLRATPLRRVIAGAARVSGTGWLGIRTLQALRTRPVRGGEAEVVRTFGNWADALWERTHYRYAMIAARDARALNALYPQGDTRFTRLRVHRDGAIAGWAVLLDTQMHGHRHFGNLRVGTIADCLAAPEDVPYVAAAATSYLRQRGVDLMISNQSHRAWGAALERCGFLQGPSNFVFAASKKLAELLEPFETTCPTIHINRGDGDGPIHL